jgi:hypothetical protein
MSDKIEDNPSFKKHRNDLKGAKTIKQIATLLSPFSKTAKDIKKALEGLNDLEIDFKKISKSPDQFNKYFGDLGWIAHESMNQDLMLECIELAKVNDLKTAEEKLTEYYTSDNLEHLIRDLKRTPEFFRRYELIRFAYEDTIANRFHAVVPVVLIVIDGSVNDLDKNKGFFTDTTNLTAWDSIAAHSSGLTKLRDILNKGRNRTNEASISLPYRNGIMHGRDIAYSNKHVAAKCWLALIAINDWAKAVLKNKINPPKEEKVLSISESLNEIKKIVDDYGIHKKKMDETHHYIDTWKARKIIVGDDIPTNGQINDYQIFTPERDAILFISNWKNKNYGGIANQIHHFSKDTNFGKEAGRVRKIFENRLLNNFRLISVTDCTPAISEVHFWVEFEYKNQKFETEIKLRMIYQNNNGDILVLGQKNGDWKFIDSIFFSKIEYPF